MKTATPHHVDGASGGAYLEILPDTRATHEDMLIEGENFTNTPGQMAILSYPICFTQMQFLQGLNEGTPFETDGTAYRNGLRVQEAVYPPHVGRQWM